MENQLKEIDLLESIKILNKRKKIIISLFFIGIAVGFVWFFLVSSEYIGTVIIEIGQLNNDVFEKPIQTINKIKAISFSNVNISADNSPGTALVEFRVSGKNYNDVDNALKEINKNIIEFHSAIYEKELSYFDKKYELFEKERESLEKDISYFMTIGQQVGGLKLETYNIQNSLYNIEVQKSKISETRVIAGPEIEEKSPSYFIIIFSSFLGLFLGIVLAFLKEWFCRNKDKI